MPKLKGKRFSESSAIQTRSQVSRKASQYSMQTMEKYETSDSSPSNEDLPFSTSFRSIANISISPIPKQASRNISGFEIDNVFPRNESPIYTSKLNLSVGAYNSQCMNNSHTKQLSSNDNKTTRSGDNLRSLCTTFNDLSIHDNQNTQTSSNLITSRAMNPRTSQPNVSFSITSTPTQTNDSLPPSTNSTLQTKDEKIDKLLLLMENNSIEMASLRLDLASSHATLGLNNSECNRRIDLFEDRLTSEVANMNQRCDSIISQLEASIDFKVSEINPQLSELRSSLQSELESRLTDSNRKISAKISRTEKSIDSKFEDCNKSLSDSVKDLLKSYLVSEEGIKVISQVTNKFLEEKGINRDADDMLLGKMREDSKESLANLRKELTGLIEKLKSSQSNFSDELKAIKISVNKMTEEHTGFTQVKSNSKETQIVNKKIDKLAVWLDTLQQNLAVKSRLLSKLDLKSRKLNLIFDGITESSNEDVCAIVSSLLVRFVPNFDCDSIESAFRLGRANNSDRSPRRVLVSFTTTTARDIVLNYASNIARAGPPGGKIYINEDIPEDLKRRRADVHKYVTYMSEKGHKIIQKGDTVILNDTLYKYEDLSAMPKGMGLIDSRTITKNGVVSFQSPHSPLSNLFLAPIKYNGITFQSAEHAFQHSKAVYCKDPVRAKAILNDPCPFEAMATGKRVEVNNDWHAKQLEIMSCILKLKLDQVPAFAAYLKSTEKLHLVENTRSLYWGAGTSYNAEAIFVRQYPGQTN